jgi:hypothetical protein
VKLTIAREGTWWVATVHDDDGGGATQVRHLDDLAAAVAEMLELRRDKGDKPMADYLPLAQRVHYLSTACIHAHHDECKNTCKFCDRDCRCPCHESDQTTEENTMTSTEPNQPDEDPGVPDQPPDTGPLPDEDQSERPERRPQPQPGGVPG